MAKVKAVPRSVSLTSDRWKVLDQVASELGISRSQLVDEATSAYLKALENSPEVGARIRDARVVAVSGILAGQVAA